MSGQKPIAIVDLDGTIADVSHRLHHIQGTGRKNWKRFFEAMHLDPPIENVIERVRQLARDHEIAIVTGRPDSYADVTKKWLRDHDVPYSHLLMRRKGDHRQDFVTKEELLRELGGRVVLALDDRAPVCEMYRRHGIETEEIASDAANQQVNEEYRKHPDGGVRENKAAKQKPRSS